MATDNRQNTRPASGGAARPQGTRFKTNAAPHGGSYRPSSYGRPATGGAGSHARPSARSGHVQPAYVRSSAQKKASPVPVIIAVVVAIAVVAGFLIFALPAITGMFVGGQEAEQVEAGVEVQVSIPEGSSGDQIASILSEAGVIPDPQDYYAAVKAQNADMQLKPGDYLFTTLQDPDEVVTQLIAGPNIAGVTLTIPEGLTVAQTASRVEEVYGIPAADFEAQAKASAYVVDYPFLEGVADDSLEGFLYPKTYTFSGTPTADTVIRAMLDQYQAEVASALDFESARSLVSERYGIDMSDYDFLILASIVEREGLDDEQRANVASTFYNRLEIGMALQSDATMMYVTGGEVTAEDLQQESPYNTYLNQGLTPTPICAPSLNSIQAVLDPPDTNYLYFFITHDEVYFSETYDEHRQSYE